MKVEEDGQHYQVHPLSWLLSNDRLEKVGSTLAKCTLSNRLLLSNQDTDCLIVLPILFHFHLVLTNTNVPVQVSET